MLQEFVFKTSAEANPLIRFTNADPNHWIIIDLYRENARDDGKKALFVIHAPQQDADRFLAGEFGRRYGTFHVLHQEPDVTSVEVSNYVMPTYKGMDPIAMAIRFLGPDVLFQPILVHQGYFHVKLLAARRTGGAFQELAARLTRITSPTDFKLVHTGSWDPVRRLAHSDGALSPRQTETLRMAVELGYYDVPRRSTLQDIADAFGISKAAVHKHLQAAEAKTIKSAV